MKTETFPFQIVTPLFLGGADQRAEGIRPASVKGALRFWWRALNWGRCLADQAGNEAQALQHLHAEEARLFGAAAHERGGGQGVFLMQVVPDRIQQVDQPFSPMQAGQLYLLGMGLATFQEGGRCQRNALQKGGTFTLKLTFHPKATPADEQQVRAAVHALALLGALGSRARHGMGSVAGTAVMSRAEYVNAVESLLGGVTSAAPLAPSLPPFSAFSRHTRLDISSTHSDALLLLDAVGREQQMYRSYGRSGLVHGRPAERNFDKTDHDLILDATRGITLTTHPKRVVFGLPHNYYFSSTRQNAAVNYAPGGQDARRASPLFLHIHPVSDGGFLAVHTLLGAQFLPAGAQIRIQAAARSFPTTPSPDWKVLHTYLDRFPAKHRVI